MMAARSSRARKRHVQQELFTCGGKRQGAGRKPKHGRAGSSHKKRDEVDGSDVLHVVLRTVADVGNLRRRAVYKAVRAACVIAAGTAARRERFRINHLSIQHNHIHMLVEAESAEALAIGMQGFQISVARQVNTALRVGGRRRRGKPAWTIRPGYEPLVVTAPRSWLQCIGLKRHGAISVHEVPSERPHSTARRPTGHRATSS